jgi:malate synthase
MSKPPARLHILGPVAPAVAAKVLPPDAQSFLVELHTRFNPRRLELLAARKTRADSLRKGNLPDFLAATKAVREGTWQVGATPQDLQDRRVEITGPAEAKMMINAFNCGAKAFMCDFEDSLSPTWHGIMEGQLNLQAAVRRTLSFTNETGKEYKLNAKIATLLVRPRGWHLPEKHLLIGSEPLSGSLVDFGLTFFHNAKEQLKRGSGPYFYLPKMESHLEARLWNDVFNFAQDHLGIPRGTIKCTVLIETILAAFEMDEILHELKDHITGLNAGRWDYIFSIIKKFSHDATRLLPDRAQVTMAVPFMRSYCELLVKTCHKRGAHAMGGMAAFIPSRKDPEVNRIAMAKVKEDKEREAKQGFDGTWIAHPDLVDVAQKAFDDVLGSRPNQKDKIPLNVHVEAKQLINVNVPGGKITTAGVLNNIDVAVRYIDNWLRGTGAVALHNLMEDAATAEIARAQLWQWIRCEAKLDDGRTMNKDLYRQLRGDEVARLGAAQHARALELLDGLVLDKEFGDFLTLPAYSKLEG